MLGSQDKSESRDSLRRGAPVVSISIGDAADFHYSMTDRLDLSARPLVLKFVSFPRRIREPIFMT